VRLAAVESRTVRSRTEGMWVSGVAVVAADRSDFYSRQVLYIINSQYLPVPCAFISSGQDLDVVTFA
jgi:hypothetical protein